MSKLQELLEKVDEELSVKTNKRFFLEKRARDRVNRFAIIHFSDLRIMSRRAADVINKNDKHPNFIIDLGQNVPYKLEFILIPKEHPLNPDDSDGLPDECQIKLIDFIPQNDIEITLYPKIKVEYATLRTGARYDVVKIINNIDVDNLVKRFVIKYRQLRIEQL